MGPIHILWSIVTGFVVGLIARALLPGADHFGFWITALVGIAGSWVGGYIGSLISAPRSPRHPAGRTSTPQAS